MAYVAITPSDFDSGSPINYQDARQVRDNWTAITNAESGAPQISPLAVAAPAPGNFYTFSANAIANYSTWTNITPSLVPYGFDYYRWQAWKTGKYRFWFNMSHSSSGAPASMRVYRNGAAFSAIYTIPTGTSTINHVFDLSLSAGDKIEIYVIGNATFAALCGMVSNPFAYIG